MKNAQEILDAINQALPFNQFTPLKNAPTDSVNSIFNQQKHIRLNKIDLEKVQVALTQIDEAKKHLIGALAALQGFDGISKRDLLVAANMAHGYDYMLQEFLHQSRGGLKTENFNLGLVKL